MKKIYSILTLIFFLNSTNTMEQLKPFIKKGELEKIQNILTDNPSLVLEADEQNNNWTALHLAASYCSKPIIELLLTFGVQTIINEPDKLGRTPLHLAVEGWPIPEESIDDQVIELLINNGAHESVNALDFFKRTPLFYAARHKNPIIAKLLLNHGAQKTINQAELQHRMTPLHHAAELGRKEVIHLLLQHGALEVADTYDSCGRKPSDMGAGRKNYDDIAAEFNYYKWRYENAPKERLAFLMASHERTGADSPANVLPTFIFRHISRFIPRIPQD